MVFVSVWFVVLVAEQIVSHQQTHGHMPVKGTHNASQTGGFPKSQCHVDIKLQQPKKAFFSEETLRNNHTVSFIGFARECSFMPRRPIAVRPQRKYNNPKGTPHQGLEPPYGHLSTCQKPLSLMKTNQRQTMSNPSALGRRTRLDLRGTVWQPSVGFAQQQRPTFRLGAPEVLKQHRHFYFRALVVCLD